MKKTIFLIGLFLAVIVSSCQSGHDEKKCQDLIDTYELNGEFTDSEIDEAMAQVVAVQDEFLDAMTDAIDEAISAKDSSIANRVIVEVTEKFAAAQRLYEILDNYSLNPDQQKKWREMSQRSYQAGQELSKKFYQEFGYYL